MKLVDLKEEYKAPADIQDHIDEWIEGAYNSPELEEWLDHAPPLKRNQTVYRVLFGQNAVDMWAKYKLHEKVTLKGIQATAHTIEAMQEGVLEPNGGHDPYCILSILLRAGKSYGRPVFHSDRDHPENVQDEFLMKKNLTFTLHDSYKASENSWLGDVREDAMVYVLD